MPSGKAADNRGVRSENSPTAAQGLSLLIRLLSEVCYGYQAKDANLFCLQYPSAS